MNKQYQVLHEKSHKLANSIAGSSITRSEAYTSYFAVYLPAVSYVLVLTSFSPKQCHHIQSKPIKIFLQKCGFSSMMHRSIVFGPRSLGGLGFKDMYTSQGIQHVIKLIQTLRTPGPPNQLLRLLLAEWQINSGSSHPLLQFPQLPCRHLEGSWLTTTRSFLASINGSLIINEYYCPSPPSDNDHVLMDEFNRVPGLGRKRLQYLNMCRIYLRVHYLSELLTPDGTHLCPGFWTGLSSQRPMKPIHKYPRQSSPSPPIWSFWRSIIRKLFCHPYTTCLRQPIHHTLPSHAPPITTIPVSPIPLSNSPSHEPNTIPVWQTHLLRHLHQSLPAQSMLHNIAASLVSSSLLAASDDSATSANATFGWTLRTQLSEIAYCYGPVHGSNPTAFRAEATGLLSLLCFLSNLFHSHHWTSLPSNVALSVHIDNLSLINRVRRMLQQPCISPSSTVSPEYDLLTQICNSISQLPLALSFHHIHSHQDARAAIHTLSLPAQANCRADHLATAAQARCISQCKTVLFPAAHCCLNIDSHTITRQYTQTLFHHSFADKLRWYILRTHAWTDPTTIDWSIFSLLCLKESPRLTFFLKWVHNYLPVGVVIHRRAPTASPFCPACGDVEGLSHFLTCTHPSRLPPKQHFITQLRRCLATSHTDPILKSILLEGVNSFLTGHPPSFPATSSRYSSLVDLQNAIGWDNLLRGFLSPAWHQLHSRFLQQSSPDPVHQLQHPFLPVMSTIIAEVHSLWKFRSSQRHSHDLALHEQERLRQVKHQITDLYRFKSSVLPTDRFIFKSSLSLHLKDSLSSLSAWLHNHARYIHQSHKLAQQSQVTHTAPLTHYFSTA